METKRRLYGTYRQGRTNTTLCRKVACMAAAIIWVALFGGIGLSISPLSLSLIDTENGLYSSADQRLNRMLTLNSPKRNVSTSIAYNGLEGLNIIASIYLEMTFAVEFCIVRWSYILLSGCTWF